MKPIEKLKAVRLAACRERPYLSSAIFSMSPVESPGIETMAVSQDWKLYFSPEFVEETPSNLLVTVILHEVAHLIRDHAARAKSLCADSKRWNLAADAEINDDLFAEGFEFPGFPILPDYFQMDTGLLVEDYYGKGCKKPPPPKCPKCKSKKLKGKGIPNSKPPSVRITCMDCGWSQVVPVGPSEDVDGNIPVTNVPEEESAPSPHDCDSTSDSKKEKHRKEKGGSGSDGKRRKYETETDSDLAISPSEAEIIRQRVAVDIQDHVQNRGHVAGSWRRYAESRLETPTIPWQNILAAYVRRAVAQVAGKVDYTYRRPSRRQSISADIIFPAMFQPKPEIAIVLDTSGSMSDDMISDCLVEIEGIAKAAGGTVHAMAVAADVQNIQRIRSAKQLALGGGGGTDMTKGFLAALTLKPKPHIIICLTDGYTPWPNSGDLKGAIGIVACTTNARVPDFLKTVRVE